jgi:hypothetical protein
MNREFSSIRASISNRRPTREQAPMRGRELIGYLTLTALVALPAVFGLWQQNVYVRTRFEIEALRKEKLGLQERFRCLRIESATLESLPRVGEEARRIGLVPREEAAAPIFISPAERAAPLGLAGFGAPGRGASAPAPAAPPSPSRTSRLIGAPSAGGPEPPL